MPQDTPEGSRIWCWLLRPLPLPTTPHHRHRCGLFSDVSVNQEKNCSHCAWPKCIKKKRHMYLLTEWAGRTGKYVARGQDNTRCTSWLRAKYFPVRPYLQSMILNLGHIALIPVFVSSNVVLKGFFDGLVQVRGQRWKEKEKEGRAQHVNVIPPIDPSSNVTDCSSVNKHFII